MNLFLIFSNQYVKSYNDPINQRTLIRSENTGKIGVYAWYNKINGKLYIGSGDPLYIRISDYYQKWYLENCTNLYIVRALNKYGMRNFSLSILEYTDEDNLISTEQKWIDNLKPEYNLNPTAGSSKGYKHTIDNNWKDAK
uniref:GIY-YIG homing endonuclease n=1 Tax=Cyathus pallidus TaxID=380665 RepID=UPI002551DCA7|nr:GIY-YIG homing endonuclease [Cyathus pallidus]WEV87293.1 GIY-YIG homing endonuclease [Cyathus pallidus]